jgi:outer membrane protein TolC
MAKHHIETSRNQVRMSILRVRQDIRRNYLEYQISTQTAQIAQDGLAYAKRQEQGIQTLLDRGLASKEDVNEADIFAQERQEDYDSAQNQAADTVDILHALLGKPIQQLTFTQFPKMEMMTDEELDNLERSALAANLPNVAALENALETEKASFREISSRNRPKIDAVAADNIDNVDEYRASGYKNIPRNTIWFGLQTNWTVLDGGVVEAEKSASLARQRRIQAQITEAKLGQQRDIANIARDARLNTSRYQTRLRRLQLLQSTVSMLEAQVTQGSVNSNELFSRKQDLQRTQIELLRATASYMLDIAQLRELAGYNYIQ